MPCCRCNTINMQRELLKTKYWHIYQDSGYTSPALNTDTKKVPEQNLNQFLDSQNFQFPKRAENLRIAIGKSLGPDLMHWSIHPIRAVNICLTTWRGRKTFDLIRWANVTEVRGIAAHWFQSQLRASDLDQTISGKWELMIYGCELFICLP